MNYRRVYDEFIKDRRMRPLAAGRFTEKHHVVPRAVGGTDDPENLIRLTPEDHFFAHLLLARIYGGKMWCPVAIMLKKARGSRRRHGWAVRAMAQARSGAGAWQYDGAEYELHHKSGSVWRGNRADMQALGISKSLACMLLKGAVKQAKGWGLPGVVGGKAAGSRHPMFNPEVLTLEHVDGRVASGTRLDLNSKYGIPRSGLSRLTSGEAKIWNGWHLPGAVLPTVGRASRRAAA